MDPLDAWSFKSKGMDLEEDFYFDYGAEEIADYQDPAELVAALKQKEEEVILAAQLGNALLLENRQLKDQSDKLHEQYADKLEVGEFYYPCAAGFVWNEAFRVKYGGFKRFDGVWWQVGFWIGVRVPLLTSKDSI